jgi:hypothetical protein
MFLHLTWAAWGDATATGTGTGTGDYAPPTESTAAARATPVILTASSIGTCEDRPADRRLAGTFVDHGHAERGTTKGICS